MKNVAQRRLVDLIKDFVVKTEGGSIRSCAAEIGISAATLSGFMNHRRQISLTMLEKILAKLPIPNEDRRFISANFFNTEFEQPTSQMNIYQVIDSIYFFAVIDLLETQNAETDSPWIANRLKISISAVDEIKSKLVELGMLVQNTDGTYRTTGKKFGMGGDMPRSNMRTLYLNALDTTREVMMHLDEKTRWNFADSSAMVIPVDCDKLVEAKKRIKEFRRSLAELLANGNRSEVYLLTVNLTPLTF